jgi:hypothetical protein
MLEKISAAWVIKCVAAPLAALAALTLTGCISSTAPVLSDAGAILGERGQIHLFGSVSGGQRDHQEVSFQWSGSRYVLSGNPIGIADFTAHAFEGRDLIVQTTATRPPRSTEYAIARKIAEGVYLIIPITEEDADDATRERFCTKTLDASCRIGTPEQLFVFAHATASKEQNNSGGIAVVLPAAPAEKR